MGQGFIYILQHHDAIGVFNTRVQCHIGDGCMYMVENGILRTEYNVPESADGTYEKNEQKYK